MTDAKERKKIRFQEFQPKGTSFLLDHGELASLKTNQDTINIIGIIKDAPRPLANISLTHSRYYHFTFYRNNMSEIADYMDGVFTEKISIIQNNVSGECPLILGPGSHYLKNDSTISGDKVQYGRHFYHQ